MNKTILVIFISLILVSCNQTATTPDPTLSAARNEVATLTSLLAQKEETLTELDSKYESKQSETPIVVYKEITQTLTATPQYTPTITNTPLPTNTLTPTIDPLKKPKGDGFYLVGVDIAPGVWRSKGTGDDCYWEVTQADGDIIDNHFGMAGGTAYIPVNGFQVRFEDCGTWEFVQNP